MANNPLAGRRLGFVGLGVMGYPMAGHLAAAGAQAFVFNRNRAKAEAWAAEHGGTVCATPAAVGAASEVVFVCVGNDADVRSVVHGADGIVAGLPNGGTLVDHTTASAELAVELEQACVERGIGFLDAPVSGGQAGAENGQLTIMVGGAQETFDAIAPVMAVYAKQIKRLGGAGAGQLTKMVNQICIAGVLQGLSEGVAFAQLAGLDVDDVISVISEGAAQSWQMNNRAGTMARDEFDFGFAVDWMRKDLDIALTTGRQLGAKLPLTALVDQFYADVQGQGGGRWDTSSLLRRLTRG